MKKLLIAFTILLTSTICSAEEFSVDKLPALKQGFAYSIADSQINYTALAEIAKWKFISVDVGYAGRAKNTGDKLIGAVSFDLLSLDKYVSWPIAKYVEFKPFAYFGAGRLNFGETGNETDYGIGATIINISF